MAMRMAMLMVLCICFELIPQLSSAGNVSYDHRSLIINGRRKLLISASIHYPRSDPSMWTSLIATAKRGGIDVIDTYVFWNVHEPSPGNYDFQGRYDLVKFVKIVQRAQMHVILRIGPFIAAEWNFGGVPVWLHYVPGTVFRTNNQSWKNHMQRFTTFIVNLMKENKLFASQGGPIILAQVENEYGYYEGAYGDGGKLYAMWAAKMAVSQNIGVPWVMCQQYDASDLVINTCNSFYCDNFTTNSLNHPKIWTENWPGWFATFGESHPHRPVEDIAYAVAQFFKGGGSFQNYYMYHGGTNFGRTAGGPFITTSYDYDAPIDEYGIARLPKWEHLRELHKAIKLCEHALLTAEPILMPLGPSQEVYIHQDSLGLCAAFISNMDDEHDKIVNFRNVSYRLPAWSVSILPDCKTVAFNTAMVGSQTSVIEMVPHELVASKFSSEDGTQTMQWSVFTEKIGIWAKPDFSKNGLHDHLNITKDSTDYLWYMTSFAVNETEDFVNKGRRLSLIIESKGHAVHVFVNQKFQGTASGNGTEITCKFISDISLTGGKNEIALLSMTVGLQNAGAFYEWVGSGLSSVRIRGLKNGTLDLSSSAWFYKIGLEGEYLKIYMPMVFDQVHWTTVSDPPKNKPLTWYKVVVDPPPGNDPIGLDMVNMGKGLAWLNGELLGRYWSRASSDHDKCVPYCNYRGRFLPGKCRTGCGTPTQRWYHIPRAWFKADGNVLVIFEETGGDPTRISLSTRVITGTCGFISEDYPTVDLDTWNMGSEVGTSAVLRLACPEGRHISEVKFASFGNPVGRCGSFFKGDCHYTNSAAVVEKICRNKSKCSVSLSESNFSKHLCPGTTRRLAVEVACG